MECNSRAELTNTIPNMKSSTSKDDKECKNQECLLVGTPRVGIFFLKQKPLEESIIGKGEEGKTFKFGKGKVTRGNVNAARNLLSREFPQVANSKSSLKFKA